MTSEPKPDIDFLQQMPLFKGLGQDALEQIAEPFKESRWKSGQVVFEQGEQGDNFYIIRSGEVQVTHRDSGQERELATLGPRDTFGEEALLFDRPRSATITALKDTHCYYLERSDFNWLLNHFPTVEPLLSVYAKSYQLARRYRFEWLGRNEVVILVNRRHPIRLIIDLWWVLLAVSGLFAIIVALGVAANRVGLPDLVEQVLWGFSGFLMLFGFIISGWAFFEYLNDFFVVTNIRVVWRERILLRSSSRQEAPLRQIQSLNAQTQSIIERALKVGDVTVRTFNSTLIMTDVPRPSQMVAVIEDYMLRARRRKQQLEIEQIRYTIRQRLGFSEEEPVLPALEEERVPAAAQPRELAWNPFRTRVQEGNVITYRKHWSVFLGHAWLPTLLFFAAVLGMFIGMILFPGWNLVLIGGIIFAILSVWLGYHYVDWLNDLYQLTEDRVIDREKKPLGKELTRSAPLKNIQSLGHRIPNLLGLILNVGTVHVNVGDDTLDFVGVYNPALVHQDISRYMENLIRSEEQAREQQERNRMATWLKIYHDEANEQRRSERRWDFG